MIIAIFTDTYPPDVNGVSAHVKNLKDGLIKRGHEVLIITTGTHKRKQFIKDGVLKCPSITFKRFYNYGIANPISYGRLNSIKKFNPDIIHIHTEFSIGFSGAMISKILKKPLIYTLHTIWDEYVHYIAPKPLIPIVTKTSLKYARFIANKAAEVIGPSQRVKTFFKKYDIQKDVTIINNCVDTALFDNSNLDKDRLQHLRSLYNPKDDITTIVFCGRIGKEKNIETLVNFFGEQFSIEDKVQLLIIGDGPYRDLIETLIKTLKMESIIKCIGVIPNKDIVYYYTISDMYITASLSENHSISMIEAMVCGLPVVHIFDVENQGQVIENVNGFIFTSSKEMYDIIKFYQNKTPKEKKDFKKSIKNYSKHFDILTLSDKIIEVYKRQIEKAL